VPDATAVPGEEPQAGRQPFVIGERALCRVWFEFWVAELDLAAAVPEDAEDDAGDVGRTWAVTSCRVQSRVPVTKAKWFSGSCRRGAGHR
jgi:hypothetical protein